LFANRAFKTHNRGYENSHEALMHVVYREVSVQDAHRILDYCRRNTIKEGGLFEVYSTPGEDIHMVIVNSCPEDEPLEKFRPLGAFYLNYLNPGTISIEEDDPHFDGAPARKYHVAAIRQVIDLLFKFAHPGYKLSFNDLPAIPSSPEGERADD
jgi:hypothetical protein